MGKERLAIKSKLSGFALIEVLLSLTALVFVVTASAGAIIYGRESTQISGERARAAFVAEEGLEAARQIRNGGFAELTVGTHGLAVSGSKWVFLGTSDTVDIFSRVVVVSLISANRKQVTSTVTWQQNPQRIGSVVLTTYMTDWEPFE